MRKSYSPVAYFANSFFQVARSVDGDMIITPSIRPPWYRAHARWIAANVLPVPIRANHAAAFSPQARSSIRFWWSIGLKPDGDRVKSYTWRGNGTIFGAALIAS